MVSDIAGNDEYRYHCNSIAVSGRFTVHTVQIFLLSLVFDRFIYIDYYVKIDEFIFSFQCDSNIVKASSQKVAYYINKECPPSTASSDI